MALSLASSIGSGFSSCISICFWSDIFASSTWSLGGASELIDSIGWDSKVIGENSVEGGSAIGKDGRDSCAAGTSEAAEIFDLIADSAFLFTLPSS